MPQGVRTAALHSVCCMMLESVNTLTDCHRSAAHGRLHYGITSKEGTVLFLTVSSVKQLDYVYVCMLLKTGFLIHIIAYNENYIS